MIISLESVFRHEIAELEYTEFYGFWRELQTIRFVVDFLKG